MLRLVSGFGQLTKQFLAFFLLLGFNFSNQSANASSALASSIFCMNADGVPSTVVKTKTGKHVPIIYWKSEAFSGAGWTPERRCQEVSARFQQYHSSESLEYITTGRMNGLPVICVAKSDGGACAGLLYTLKPGQNATATLKQLFEIRTKPGTAPLEETTARMYVSVDSIIRNKSDAVVTPELTAPAPVSSSPLPLF